MTAGHGLPIAVWWSTLEQPHPEQPAALSEEIAQVANRRDPGDQQASLTARGLMRAAAARLLGERADTTRIARHCPVCGSDAHGRPYAGPVHLSASHAHGRVLVAASLHAPIGVDLDAAPADWRALLPQLLATGESTATPQEFIDLWATKESLVKATGDGMTVPFAGLRVAPLEYPGRPELRATWHHLALPAELAADGRAWAARLAILSPARPTAPE